MNEPSLANQLFANVIGNSVFAAMLVVLWKWSTETMAAKDDDIKEQAREMKDLHEKVLNAFMEQTKVSEGMKTAIENNTKVVDTLPERVRGILQTKS